MPWQFYDDPAKNVALADPFHPDNVNAWVKQDLARQRKQKTPQKQRGRGGFLSSLISEGGGAAGAAGGAAIGTALLPGVGTLIGAGLGGLLGGTTGRGIENKVRDNQNFLGAGGSARAAFGEGALSGAFGLAGAGWQAAKGAKAAGMGLKEALSPATGQLMKSQGVKSVGQLGGEQSGRLAQAATRLESRALGFGAGEKIAGKPVDSGMIKEMLKTIKSEKIKVGHPDQVEKQVFNKLTRLGEDIEKQLGKANRPLTNAERKFLSNNFVKEIDSNVVLANNPAAQKLKVSLGGQFSKINSVEDVVTQRRNIQEAINFARNSTSAVPGTEEVLRSAQTHLNKLAGTISPKLKTLNNRYSKLSEVHEGTLNASKNLTAQSRNAGGGLTGRALTGDTAAGVKAKVGQQGLRLADALGTVSATGLPAAVKAQAVPRVIGSVNALTQQGIESPEAVEPEVPEESLGSSIGGLDTPAPQIPQSAYPLEQALADYQAAPDAKTQKQVMEYYDFVSKAEKAQEGSELTADQKNKQAKAKALTQSIGLLLDNFQNAGGGQGASGLPASIAGRTPGIRSLGLAPNAQKFEDMRKALIAPLARAISGEVGVLTDYDIKRAEGLLPRLSDPDNVAQSKIENLLFLIEQSGSAGTPTAGVLQQGDLQLDLASLQEGY